MIRIGKIARLPKAVQEELNRRLDDNEPGQNLVAWLNSLPDVRSVMAAKFGSRPIRQQNLSEWRNGGYRDWLRRQERCESLRQMWAGARDFAALMDADAFQQQMSLVLMADLVLAVRQAVDQTDDPRERALCLAQLAEKIARLRREDSNATRVRIVRERWERELARDENNKMADGRLAPSQALLLQRLYIDLFSGGISRELALADECPADGGFGAESPSSALGQSNPTQSGLLRPVSDSADSSPLDPDRTPN
jgi:hypothetical protein